MVDFKQMPEFDSEGYCKGCNRGHTCPTCSTMKKIKKIEKRELSEEEQQEKKKITEEIRLDYLNQIKGILEKK